MHAASRCWGAIPCGVIVVAFIALIAIQAAVNWFQLMSAKDERKESAMVKIAAHVFSTSGQVVLAIGASVVAAMVAPQERLAG